MNLTNDEIIDLMDCVNNRIADLHIGRAQVMTWEEIEGEIGRLNTLVAKLGEELETDNG